ncbi:MAG: class I SAM-dependent methyltransferase [Anaerolineales bacterium]|jgi:2-polyprenyl-3-methyl-5-hydroxy-6-metoxy-1,4-benzoquinol methylase
MDKLIQFLKSIIWKMLIHILNSMNSNSLGDFAYQLVSEKTKIVPAKEALQLLFTMDNHLYFLEKRIAVLYGNGIHPKHRHIRYHDFFVERISNGSKVLDVGCGNGAVAFDVAQKTNSHVLGIDLDGEFIQSARQQFSHPNIQYIVGDARIDLPNEMFDYVILSNVLEHIEERVEFLINLQKRISPASIFIRVPLFERDWRVPLKQELGLEWRLDKDHKTEYTLDSFEMELNAAKLKTHHQETRWGEIWAEVKPFDT